MNIVGEICRSNFDYFGKNVTVYFCFVQPKHNIGANDHGFRNIVDREFQSIGTDIDNFACSL